MRFERLVGVALILGVAATLGVRPAEARNPHCAGGIQYVVQGMRDKDKGNTEDYQRQMGKAIQQLETCASEDPADYEAIGYLGWAYAEVDSAGPAGKAFQKAFDGATAKGDKKKAELIENNQKSYWAKAFNDGIDKIQKAQKAYPDFCKTAESDGDKAARTEAEKFYATAVTSLTRANLIKPNDPQTLRNLGSTYAFQCQYQTAEAWFHRGLEVAPNDTTLQQSVKSVRANHANQLVEQKKYDEALAFYGDLAKQEPGNADHWLSIGDVNFRRAQGLKGDPQKAEFKAAGDAYAKASDLRPTDPDLAFNAGLGYQNAGIWDRSGTYWTRAVELRPNDADALSSLAAVLAEDKKCDGAVSAAHRAVGIKPKEKNLHRQLGAIYTKCGNNAKATEELMIYLAMQNGKPVDDPAARAKAAAGGSGAAKTFAAEGAPEEIIPWEADGQKYESWFYWEKKRAFTFNSGSLVTRSDWTAMSAATAPKK